jgi:hypothetical protein
VTRSRGVNQQRYTRRFWLQWWGFDEDATASYKDSDALRKYAINAT